MNRNDLLAALKICRPALASNDLIPVLSHYCFDGDRVFAYNDVMCIAVDIDVGISCALPGDPLYRVIDSFSSDEVYLEAQKTDVLVRGKTKKAKVTMPFLTAHTFLYRDPGDKEATQDMELTEETVNAMQFCLDSVPDNPLLPYQMGITVSKDGWMYASDGTTVAYADTSLKCKKAVLLPAAFCKQVVSLFSVEEAGTLCIGEDFAIGEFHPGVMIFTKLPFASEVGKFERVLDEHVPTDANLWYVDVPKQLLSCLDRCLAVLSSDLEKTLEVSIDKDGFDVRVESKLGTVDEQFAVGTGAKKEATYLFDVEILRKCIMSADQIAFLQACAALVTDEVGTRLISQRSAQSED